MNILRVFAIAVACLIVSCAEVPIAPLVPPVAQEVTTASVPASLVVTEDGDATRGVRERQGNNPDGTRPWHWITL